MRRAARLLAAALVLTLCAASWTPAGTVSLPLPTLVPTSTPTPTPTADNGLRTCATAEELLAILAEDGGGAVELSADLVWSEYGDPIVVTRPVTVRMGPHSLRVGVDGYLSLSGPVRFEGGPGPLLRVAGDLITGPGVVVAASGPGAVAVQVDRAPLPMDGGFTGNWISELAEVSASGVDAAAVRVTGEGPFELKQTCLTAQGEGAVGLRSTTPVRLSFCTVSGQSAAVEGPAGGVELEGCRADPSPAGAKVIERVAVPGRLAQRGYSIAAGSVFEEERGVYVWEDYFYLLGEPMVSYSLRDPGGGQALNHVLAVEWSGLPVDLSVPGVYTARCTPVGFPDWFPVQPSAFDVPVHVVDPDTPHLASASRLGKDAVILMYLTDIRQAETITLWYRPAEGGAWRDVMDIPGSGVTPNGAHVDQLEPNRDYLFRLEVKGGPMEGLSAEMPFRYYDDDADRAGSGDRDDDDWGDQGEDPPSGEIIPPPENPWEDSIGPESPWEDGMEPEVPWEDDWEPEDFREDGVEPEDSREDGVEPEAAVPGPGPSPSSAPPVTAPPSKAEWIPPPEGATVSLTSAELADQLLANPEAVTFIGEGIKAILPAALLRELALGDGEAFSAGLEAPGPGVFSVRFWAGDRAIEDLGGPFTVEVAWAGAAPPVCLGPDGTPVAAADGGDGRYAFTLTAAGRYTLLEGEVPEAPPSAETSAPAGTPPPAGTPAPAETPTPGGTLEPDETPEHDATPDAPSSAPPPAASDRGAVPTAPADGEPENAEHGQREGEVVESGPGGGGALPVLAALCASGAAAAWFWKRRRGR